MATGVWQLAGRCARLLGLNDQAARVDPRPWPAGAWQLGRALRRGKGNFPLPALIAHDLRGKLADVTCHGEDPDHTT